MTTRVDVEEIETTKGEKLLAAILAGFLLIGVLWIYFHIDVERDHAFRMPEATLSATDRAALARLDRARARLGAAERREAVRRRTLIDRREAYRTALDEGSSSAPLKRRYLRAQAAYGRAQSQVRAASRERAAARPAANAAQDRLAAAERREQARVDAAERHDGRVSFVRRLMLLLALLGAAYLLLGRLRAGRSRYLPAGMAAVAAVAIAALVMAIDYLTDYVEVTELGVLVLSLAGALLTLLAFVALQRYLARRIPERRVRKGECPFCGFPAGEHAHCEGCGRDVVASCAACEAPRRVGTRHCRACGAT